MNELIAVAERMIGENLIQTADARELHAFLENGDHFATWIADRIKQYDFVEGVDFVTYSGFSEKGRPPKEYAISLDMAKELSMVDRSAKGKQARQYFIACERRASGIVTTFDGSAIKSMVGAMKGSMRKALSEMIPEMLSDAVQDLLPALVNERIMSGRLTVVEGVCAVEVVEMAGYKTGMRPKGASQFVTRRLARFHEERGVPIRRDRRGIIKARLFDEVTARQWLAAGGKTEIDHYIAGRKGQGSLKLVQS